MNEAQPSTPPASAPAGPSTPPPPPTPARRRRRWLRWVLALVLVALVVLLALPYLAAIPGVRDRALILLSARANLQISAKELSLGWFSPVVVGDISVQNDDAQQAVLTVKKIEGDTSLIRLIFSHDAGHFRIVQPELNIEFDNGGWNLARLLQVMARAAILNNRSVNWEIVDCRLSLRGPSSTRPVAIERLTLQGMTIRAADNPLGVPLLRGGHAQLLSHTEITPELCNDLLKFIAPVLSQTTSASGRVSLELEEFSWPLGKPANADVKGTLTLHSVDVGPGGLGKLFADLIELKSIPATVQIAKDDVVSFSLHDGRVYHENLIFSLSAIQNAPTIRSHGSVGLDESLDWFLDFSSLGGVPSTETTVRNLLGHVTLHFVGTLSSPKLAAPALKLLSDWLQQRRSEKREDASRSGLLPGRRSATENPPRAPATSP